MLLLKKIFVALWAILVLFLLAYRDVIVSLGGLLKKSFVALCTIVVLFLVAYVGTGAIAKATMRRGAAVWHASIPVETLRARYPDVPERNDTAAKLEQAGLALGIYTDTAVFGQAEYEMRQWLTTEVERNTGVICEPPWEVREYLVEHRGRIDALVEILVSATEPPRWPLHDPVWGDIFEFPNFFGHSKALRLLSAASLASEIDGDNERAWRCQHASWVLSRGLLARPELISRVIGMSGSRYIAGVERKLTPPAPGWTTELTSFDFHAATFESIRFEAYAVEVTFAKTSVSRQILRERGLGIEVGPAEVIRSIALRPLDDWAAAEIQLAAAEETVKLAKKEPCAIDVRAVSAAFEARIPRLARLVETPWSFYETLLRANTLGVAIEGSSKVLELKRRRAESPDGGWPATADDLRGSRCSGAYWNYVKAADGSMTFSFDGKVDKPEFGFSVPLEYADSGK